MAAKIDVPQSDAFAMTGPLAANLTVVQSDEFIMVGPTVLTVGDIIVVGCAQVLITGVNGNLNYVGEVIQTESAGNDNSIPFDPSDSQKPYAPGEWGTYAPTAIMTGLDHLAGKIVTGVADGIVVPPTTVGNDGTVMLPRTAFQVVLGLGYESQLQTLRLDVGDPTLQGKRKNISALSVIFDCSRGVVAGTDFVTMDPFPDLVLGAPYSAPGVLTSEILRIPLPGSWEVDGQICLQQSYPLPCTILGVIPEFMQGDTEK